MDDEMERHPVCLPCVLNLLTGGAHTDCTGRDGSRWCECLCDWMVDDD